MYISVIYSRLLSSRSSSLSLERPYTPFFFTVVKWSVSNKKKTGKIPNYSRSYQNKGTEVTKVSYQIVFNLPSNSSPLFYNND